MGGGGVIDLRSRDGGWHCPTWVSLTYLVGAGHLCGGRGALSYMDVIDLSS